MSEDDDAEQPEAAAPSEPEPTTAEDLEGLLDVLEGDVEPKAEPTLRAVRAVQTLFHSGPLPASQWFRDMEEIEPGTTRAIVGDYLHERQHQRELQREALTLDNTAFHAFSRYQSRQLAAAWSIAALFGAAGIVLIATGHSIVGLVWLVVEIAVLAGVFLGREVASRRSPSTTGGEGPALPAGDQPGGSS